MIINNIKINNNIITIISININNNYLVIIINY